MKIFFKQKLFIFLCLLFSVNYTIAREGNQISIVGSSTVFPFATIVAERFAKKFGNTWPRYLYEFKKF